jgi:hypothetical protein
MFKKISFLLYGVLLYSAAYANDSSIVEEEKYNYSFFRLNYGITFPSGDFSSENINLANSGFAKVGSSLGLTFGFNFLKDFHYLIEWNGYTNQINTDKLSQYYKNQFSSSLNWETQTSSWTNSNLMTGLGLSFPIKKVFLDSEVMIGYSYAIFPEMLVVSSDEVNEYKTKISESTSTALSWKFKTGIRYKFYNKLTAFLNFSHHLSKHTFDPLVETNNNDYEDLKTPRKINFSNTQISAGLGLSW